MTDQEQKRLLKKALENVARLPLKRDEKLQQAVRRAWEGRNASDNHPGKRL